MALTWRSIFARIAYAALFCLALPAAFIFWTWRLQVDLPAIHTPLIGATLTALGLALIAAAALALLLRGGGLPMNAFPPPRLVNNGIYALVPHPIYLGAVLICAGISLLAGSAAALWLVTPLLALGATALVWGYERADLLRRFGTLPQPWLRLPPPGPEKPTFLESLAVTVLVFAPWMVLYHAVGRMGWPPDAINLALPFEKSWPVLAWTEPFYINAYFIIPAVTLLAPTCSALRRFGLQGLIATLAITFIYLLLPIIAPPRPHTATGLLGDLLNLEHGWTTVPTASFPSFHVIWACLAAELLAHRSRAWSVLAWIWAATVAASCITTGMHSLADIAAALFTYAALRHYEMLYAAPLRLTERLANAWRERRFGPIRIINHGIFAAAAAFTGVLLVGWLTGALAWTATITLCGLLTAAIWAQTVEGSPTLLRPFGYYGFIVGGCLGVALCAVAGGPAMLLFAAAATAAPWIQALGRLRCTVQGCCHGRLAPPRFGIRIDEPHSRVSRIEALRGQPIHPTQLYSILGNLIIGLSLARLWSLAAPLPLIAGLYLILSGLARFVEESYRGEPQTPTYGRLAIYHWMAILSTLAGVAVSCVHGAPAPAPTDAPSLSVLGAALAAAVLFWLAMAVDLPQSRRRFARLSG